jgi:hypothetical protein
VPILEVVELLDGHHVDGADEYAYEYGRLAGALPFADLKLQAHINDAARAADQADDFSVEIRRGRAGF